MYYVVRVSLLRTLVGPIVVKAMNLPVRIFE